MELGERIRQARIAKGLSQADLAKLIKISQPSVQNIENGRTKDPRKLPELAAALDIPMSELRPSAASLSVHRNVTGFDSFGNGVNDFPVYFTVGADTEYQGAWVMSADPVEFVERPALLARVKDSYGVRVSGHSMEPAYESGDVVFVHPYLPPSPGVDVLLRSEVNGEHRALIKRLVRETVDEWFLLQHNPPREFSLQKTIWGECHRIVGKYNRK